MLLAPKSEPATPRRSVAAVSIGCCALALLGRLAVVTQPVNSDSAMFVYMGKLVASGGRMGVDLVDNKLPSVGLFMSVPYRAFGATWWAYGVLGVVMSIVATALLVRAAARCLGPAARWPVMVAAAVWLNFPPTVFGTFQLETVQVFFTSIAAAAVMELLSRFDPRDAFLAGLSIGMAMWAKPTAGAMLPAIALAALLHPAWRFQQKLAAIAVLALGLLIPLAVCVWLVVATGMAGAVPATLAQLRDYSANSSADWIDLTKPLIVLAVVLLPVAVLGWIFRRDRVDGSRNKTLATFVVAWIAMELIAVVSQRRMYAYHFLVIAPPAALLTGLWPRMPRVRSQLLAFGPAVAACVALAVPMFASPTRKDRSSRVIDYLAQHAVPSETVWLDDYARALVETDLSAGSRVPLLFLFANSNTAPAHFSELMLNDFQTRQPRYVVLPSDPARLVDLYRHHMIEMVRYPERADAFADAIGRISGYVKDRYSAEQSIDGLTVWKRNDPAFAQSAASARD